MTAFAVQRRSMIYRSVLSLDRFAEDVTYLPACGPPRTVRALVQPATRRLVDQANELVTREEIDVRVSRDPAAELDGIVISGIDRPQLKDALLRAGEEPDTRFSFEYVLRATADTYLLRFSRRRREQMGAIGGRQ